MIILYIFTDEIDEIGWYDEVVMVYVIGFIVISKVEQTCLVVYPIMIWLYNMWVGQGKR